MDEISIIADTLLGDFEHQLTCVARQTRYLKRSDKTRRIFGGYNILFFGDWWQLPPIPEPAALFNPPVTDKGERARKVSNMFWKPGPDSINYLQELTIQKRIDDPWYNDAMHECRNGELQQENYCFLMGLPTKAPRIMAQRTRDLRI